MAGIIGGCLGIEPITEAGDSVIRVNENINESVDFPQAEELVQTIIESVTVNITWDWNERKN